MLSQALEVPLDAGFATNPPDHVATCRRANEQQTSENQEVHGTTRRDFLQTAAWTGATVSFLTLFTASMSFAQKVSKAVSPLAASPSPSLGEQARAMLASIVDWRLGNPSLEVLGNPYPHDEAKNREALRHQNLFLSSRFVVDGNPEIGLSWLDTWIDALQYLVDSSEDRYLTFRTDPFRALGLGINVQQGLTFLTNMAVYPQQEVVNPQHTTITGINPGGRWGWLWKFLQGTAHESSPVVQMNLLTAQNSLLRLDIGKWRTAGIAQTKDRLALQAQWRILRYQLEARWIPVHIQLLKAKLEHDKRLNEAFAENPADLQKRKAAFIPRQNAVDIEIETLEKRQVELEGRETRGGLIKSAILTYLELTGQNTDDAAVKLVQYRPWRFPVDRNTLEVNLLLPNAKPGISLPDSVDLLSHLDRFASVEARRLNLVVPPKPQVPYDPLDEKNLPILFQQVFLNSTLNIHIPQIAPDVEDTLDMSKIVVPHSADSGQLPKSNDSVELPKSPRQLYLEGLLEINVGLQEIAKLKKQPQGRYAIRPFITTLIDASRLEFNYRKILSTERTDYEIALTQMFGERLKKEIAVERKQVADTYNSLRTEMESAMNGAALATEQAAGEWTKFMAHMAKATATQGAKEPYDPYTPLLEVMKHYEELQLAQMKLVEARLALTTFEKAGLDSLFGETPSEKDEKEKGLLNQHTDAVRLKVLRAVEENRIKEKSAPTVPVKGKKKLNPANRAA